MDQEMLEGAANSSLESEEEDLNIALSERRQPLGWRVGLE